MTLLQRIQSWRPTSVLLELASEIVLIAKVVPINAPYLLAVEVQQRGFPVLLKGVFKLLPLLAVSLGFVDKRLQVSAHLGELLEDWEHEEVDEAHLALSYVDSLFVAKLGYGQVHGAL